MVAEQVKNLANESAKAAGRTTELIETTVTVMNRGIVIADETSEDMKEVMKSTTVATEKINQIVEMLEKDVERMHEVNDSIEQVSSVVDNNSATSEETAGRGNGGTDESIQDLRELCAPHVSGKIRNAASQSRGIHGFGSLTAKGCL